MGFFNPRAICPNCGAKIHTFVIGCLAVLAIACFAIPANASSAPTAQAAGCGTLTVGGKSFVFNKSGLSCKKAKGLARLTYRTNKPPPGWRCPDASPGNNRRDGAQCFKPGTNKFYGYHVFD